MSAVKSLLELTDYIDYFNKEVEKIELEPDGELPEFYIPGWPKEASWDTAPLKLGERQFLRPVAGNTAPRGIMTLEKIEADVEIWINDDGAIMVRLTKYEKSKGTRLFSKDPERKYQWTRDYNSKRHWSGGGIVGFPHEATPSAFEKAACLIIFCQFLGEIKNKVVEGLDGKLKRGQASIGEHRELARQARNCLAPLIPYIAIEKLAKK